LSGASPDPGKQLVSLLRLWAQHGLDRERGGYWNRLTHALEPVPEPHTRVLVHLRLIYAFCEGVRRGAAPWARAAAEHGLEFLEERFRDRARGGYFLTTDRAGAPQDRRKELYAHAFAVFALAHCTRALGDSGARLRARALLEQLDALASPAGGFFECADEAWHPLPGPRLQNPHMHLLEALLALLELGPDTWVAERADRIFALCADRFVDRVQGCLGEHFTADWKPSPGAEGRIVEPGHHFEWVWLLHAYAGARGCGEALQLAELLQRFACRHGIDGDGLVFDGLWRSGRVARDGKRLWPQTEHVKALAARGERERLCATLAKLSAAYVDPASGAWREQLDRAGRVTSTALNATSVYHVVFALGEAGRGLAPESLSSS
jgi:mannose-6-phosphate isomerase